MSNLAHLGRKIKSVGATSKITKSLKIVSSNKSMIYKDLEKKTTHYIKGITKLFYNFFTSPENFHAEINKIFIKDPSGPNLWIIIGTDIGMCGDFNNKLIAHYLNHSSPRDLLIIIGTKLFNSLRYKINVDNVIHCSTSEFNANRFSAEITKVIYKALRTFRKSRCSKLSLVYLKDKRLGIIEKFNILPFTNKYFDNIKNIQVDSASYTVSYPEVVVNLIPKYFETLLTKCIIKSKILEHVTRRNLMHEATKNAEELLEEYQILYNKARQAAITQEISEIVAAVQTKKN